jgi:hypothetical protein
MADEKSHTEQGQIERAQRLRRVIDNLKEGRAGDDKSSSSKGKSLKEQIEERAAAARQEGTSDSE